MQWISERDATDAALMHQALVLQADDPIGPAYVEFWKRILADGCAHAASSGWRSLGIAICERQSEADDQGYMHARFRDGQRALFYNIQCPSFPDDGTSVVNDRVHAAATRLVRHMAPAEGTFPGIALRLEQQNDGTWRQSMTLLPRAAA